MSGHTPGPWRIEDIGLSDGASVVAGSGPAYEWAFVAHVGEDAERGISEAQAQANARLIAAAPALLQACKDLWGYLYATNNPGSLPQFCRDAETTIAQAEGREP